MATAFHHTRKTRSPGEIYDFDIEAFNGEILEAFQAKTVAWQRTMRKPVKDGARTQIFPALWKASAGYHTPGTTLTGQQVSQEKRTVELEDNELISSIYFNVPDEVLQGIDSRAKVSKQLGIALAEQCDADVFANMIIAARLSARSPFPAGNVVTVGPGGDITTDSEGNNINGDSIAEAFPRTLVGSKTLQLALQLLGEMMDGKNVPDDGRVMYMDRYLMNVLRQDTTLLSGDYIAGENNLLYRKLSVVEGFEIVHTEELVRSDLSGRSTPTIRGSAVYDVDASLSVCVGGTSDAVATVTAGVPQTNMDWIAHRREWLTAAAMMKGHSWLRPEAACEIQITGPSA